MKLYLLIFILIPLSIFAQSKKKQIELLKMELQQERESNKELQVINIALKKKITYFQNEHEVCNYNHDVLKRKIGKLDKEVRTLRSVMGRYVTIIDSLQTVINPPKKKKDYPKNKTSNATEINALFAGGFGGNGNGTGDSYGDEDNSYRSIKTPIKKDGIEVDQSCRLQFQVKADEKGRVYWMKYLPYKSTTSDQKLIDLVSKRIRNELIFKLMDNPSQARTQIYTVNLRPK
jgi:hypothetical protein